MERRAQLDLTLPSPLQKVSWKTAVGGDMNFYIKREDLIHQDISGNKWRKLYHNIQLILRSHLRGIITFGGAFSNHIHATAAAGYHYGIPTIGIIRGEDDPDNPTLQQARGWGMMLYFVSRSAYRKKADAAEVQEIIKANPDYLILPEGGSNELAMKGTAEIVAEANQQLTSIDHFIVSAGTGATAAGMIPALLPHQHLWVVSALKGDFLQDEISKRLDTSSDQWTLLTEYHRGGYAKVDTALVDWINTFYDETGVPLDPVYNAKSMLALQDLYLSGFINPTANVCNVHTGGLQGSTAYNYMAARRNQRIIQLD